SRMTASLSLPPRLDAASRRACSGDCRSFSGSGHGVTSRVILDYHFGAAWGAREALRWHRGVVGRAYIAALPSAGALVAARARGPPSSVEAIANYAGADGQAVLEAGARREGGLLIYTTGTQIKPLLDRFERKYPYLKVELARASSADTARKVLEEYR